MRYLRTSVILALVAGVSAGLWFWRASDAKPPTAEVTPAVTATSRPERVKVLKLRHESLEITTTATGSLLGRESVALVSELSRRLVRVWAKEGKHVAAGELLFELDAQDLRAEVKKLDVDAHLAQVTFERAERLQKEGLVNQEELDLARAKVAQLEAQRDALQVTIAKTRIRAPFAGTLGLRRVSEGAWLTPATVLTTLQDTSQLKVDFTLPERYASSLAIGTEFHFRVPSSAEQLSAKIVAIEPAIDTTTRSITVRGVVAEGHHLVPGTSVDIALPLRVDRALMVPAIALQSSVDGRRAFIAQAPDAGSEEPSHLKSVVVEVGFRSADRVQLLSGVHEGDLLVVSNLLRLRDGLAVEVEIEAPPPEAPAVGSAPVGTAPIGTPVGTSLVGAGLVGSGS